MSHRISLENGRGRRRRFLAQSEDITPEMFKKKSGKVEEFNLRAIDVLDDPHSPYTSAPEGSEEGSSPRASFSDNGDLNASLLEAFNKKSGKVKEFKSSAIYDSDDPPSPPTLVPEGSEEGSSPRASLSDNCYLNASFLEAFNKKSGKVKEFKSSAIYDSDDPPSPPTLVPEGSEEGSSPRASLSDNCYLNASFLEADSLRPALGREMPLSSQPEQTRSKNVPNGGSGLTLHFPGDSNRPSAKVAINFHISITDQGGHTFNQIAGSGDSRQCQAGNVSGGTVTQGNVPFAAGGAANMEDDG